MLVAGTPIAFQATACRLPVPLRARPSTRRAAAIVRALQEGTEPPPPSSVTPLPPSAVAADQQPVQQAVVVPPAASAQPVAQGWEEYEQVAAAQSDATPSTTAVHEQQRVVEAVPVPSAPPPSRLQRLDAALQHPAARLGGMAAATFLGASFLITLFRMSRDPTRKRSKTINKNKLVVDTVSKFLPGKREAMNSGSFRLLKLQTGFTSVEVFRKYLWFLLRERQFDEGALDDLVALKAALTLTDEEVADALRERAQRVYEKYGTVMVNMEGMSQAGIERKASARNLFIKLLSLTESRPLLSEEAAAKVDLGKVFGVTQRDVLTLRSGYSAEGEGAQLDGEGGGGGGESEEE